MKELFEAITSRFNIANDFKTAISSQFYLNNAPQSISRPYAVFTMPVNNPDYNFTSTFENVEIQIDILDTNKTSNILDVAKKCMAHFDDCELTITGYQFGKMERESNFLNEDPEEEIQTYVINYLVHFRKDN